MQISLMNLGDTPRVFHNRLGKPVIIPVGKVVITDLSPMDVQNLKFPARPETILVCPPEMTEIPAEMRGVVDLLAVLEFESHEKALQRFAQVIPPGHSTATRPSRMQMRQYLHTMIEDYIQAQTSPKPKTLHDDEDPQVLERELERQKRGAEEVPLHPFAIIEQEKNLKLMTQPARQLYSAPPRADKPEKKPKKNRRRS